LCARPSTTGFLLVLQGSIGESANRKETIMSQQPAHRIRVSNISVAIWRNSNDNGTWYSVSAPQRSYKTDDEAWRNTDALGQDDIQNARKALDLAHDWIICQADAGRKTKKESVAA
jgi:hypothetical protein